MAEPLRPAEIGFGSGLGAGHSVEDSRFGHRMRGQGVFADLYRQRMQKICRRLQLNSNRRPLNTEAFRPPARGPQLNLF